MENQKKKKMENEMETGEYVGIILGAILRSCWDNGKENRNYYKGLCRGYKKSHNKRRSTSGLGFWGSRFRL